MGTIANIGRFVRAVVRHWVIFLAGAVMTVLGLLNSLIEREAQKGTTVPFVPPWVFAVATAALLLGACFRAWRDAVTAGEEAVALIAGERDDLKAREDDRNRVDIRLNWRPLEPIGVDILKLALEVTNYGPDSDFVANVQEVFGLPSGMPPRYGNFSMAWESSTDEALRVYSCDGDEDKNKRILVMGHWLVSRYQFTFRLPQYNGSGANADGIPFSPPGTIEFDLELRDTQRQKGVVFRVCVDFDDPERRLPTAIRIDRRDALAEAQAG